MSRLDGGPTFFDYWRTAVEMVMPAKYRPVALAYGRRSTWETGEDIFACQDTIAADAGFTGKYPTRTVRRHTNWLEENGWLVSVRRGRNENGTLKTNEWRLRIPSAGVDAMFPSRKSCSQHGDNLSSYLENKTSVDALLFCCCDSPFIFIVQGPEDNLSSGDDQGKQADNWGAYLDGTLDNTDVDSSDFNKAMLAEVVSDISKSFGASSRGSRQRVDDFPGDTCRTCHGSGVLRFGDDREHCPTCQPRVGAA